jgi:hypothetical protein
MCIIHFRVFSPSGRCFDQQRSKSENDHDNESENDFVGKRGEFTFERPSFILGLATDNRPLTPDSRLLNSPSLCNLFRARNVLFAV